MGTGEAPVPPFRCFIISRVDAAAADGSSMSSEAASRYNTEATEMLTVDILGGH